MITRTWATSLLSCGAVMALMFASAAPSLADQYVLKKGTDVKLSFDSTLNSKTAKPGDRVAFKVDEPVQVDGKTVIAAGTSEHGTVVRVNKRARYGVNARIRLQMDPIRTTSGTKVPIGFKEEGPIVSGKTGGAAAATAGGAILLGPVGLIGGYFITGKTVDAKPGDKMTVQVDHDVTIRTK
jgi:hypothetical protein